MKCYTGPQTWAFVNMVMNIWVIWKAGDFLTSLVAVSLAEEGLEIEGAKIFNLLIQSFYRNGHLDFQKVSV
jgi:hypothetical protein